MAAKTLENIVIFEPQYKSVIWGGQWIAELKGEKQTASDIGESWEISAVANHESVVADGSLKGLTISELIAEYGDKLLGRKVVEKYGETFPLLIKLIDAQDNLSLQVHPDDALAERLHNSRGKTEMWYVIDAKPGAKIYCGLAGPLTADNFDDHIKSNTIMDMVVAYPSASGQFYYIPAGTLHAIGAGNLIAEIQESSDITYRVYDHNRVGADGKPRQLHVDESRMAIDFTYPHAAKPTAEIFVASQPKAVSCEHFTVDYLNNDGERVKIDSNGDSFNIILVTSGSLEINADGSQRTVTAGHTALIPASVKEIELSGNGKALSVYF